MTDQEFDSLDPVEQAKLTTQGAAHYLVMAEVCYYRREIQAQRDRSSRSILRAEAAKLSAQDFCDDLVGSTMSLCDLGEEEFVSELLANVARKVGRERSRIAIAELVAGRRVPDIPAASELAMPEQWAAEPLLDPTTRFVSLRSPSLN